LGKIARYNSEFRKAYPKKIVRPNIGTPLSEKFYPPLQAAGRDFAEGISGFDEFNLWSGLNPK